MDTTVTTPASATYNTCVSCVNASIESSSVANSIEIKIIYSCEGSALTAIKIPVTFDLNTVATDPYT